MRQTSVVRPVVPRGLVILGAALASWVLLAALGLVASRVFAVVLAVAAGA